MGEEPFLIQLSQSNERGRLAKGKSGHAAALGRIPVGKANREGYLG
ncbi:MAG: hypothetical protein ACQKBW_07810 [Puniceicoccales bacterium]